jgi:hypothetical protein
MISFCTWIKNRFHQFKEVLPINLERIGVEDEWNIVDVDSDDEFAAWLPQDKRINIVKISMEELHFAKLYNISHKLAKGDMIVNLDADNYIGENFCEWVHKLKEKGFMGHSWSNDWSDGTYGRIVIPTEVFYNVGGYDESFEPCGFQDTDIMQRVIKSGTRCETSNDIKIYGGSISNTREETMKYVSKKESFGKYNSLNHEKYKKNIDKRIYKANQ